MSQDFRVPTNFEHEHMFTTACVLGQLFGNYHGMALERTGVSDILVR